MEGRGVSAQDAADIVGADTGTMVVDLDFEPDLPDRLQVVGEPLGELLDGVHVEGQAEILGQPLEGDEEVARQDALDGVLVPEVELVALEERGLVGLGHVERRAFVVGLQGVAVGFEERGQGRGDGIGFPRGLHADAVERGDPVEELRVELFEGPVDLLLRLTGQHHEVQQAEIVVAAPLVVVSQGPVKALLQNPLTESFLKAHEEGSHRYI